VILLDTHTLVWLVNDPGHLSVEATAAIRKSDRSGGLAISAFSLWELAWLVSRRRLEVLGTVDAFVRRISSRTAIRPITAEIAVLASQFPAAYPGDPCDRLIGATALAEGILLVTKDRGIRGYRPLRTIW
jgi:PIN domain nuclease of toxin-antitoxin system